MYMYMYFKKEEKEKISELLQYMMLNIVINKGGYQITKTLESWHTAMTNEAESNSKLLPRQYLILLK